MITTIKLSTAFRKLYKKEPEALYFSPGRVNLIGEHIDYHGGLVLPAALSIGTYAAFSKRSDDIIRVCSKGYVTTPLDFSLNNLEKDDRSNWANYIRGVFSVLKKAGYIIDSGLNLYIESDMPTSGGLSSSSSLELLLIAILNEVYSLNISRTDMAILGRKVENDYIGVLSGIMDQFVIAHGKKDNALLLNTSTLEFVYTPLDLGAYSLVVVNTNKKRGLADSKYNERYTETMGALKTLQKQYSVNFLTELKPSDLPQIQEMLNPLLFRRVRHVITEQERTVSSAKALQNGDVLAFAQYLNASHESLKNDYEVTGAELDNLVLLMRDNGAIGARMTGAGFGGCAIAIVPHAQVETMAKVVSRKYFNLFGFEPTFFKTTIENGTHRLQ